MQNIDNIAAFAFVDDGAVSGVEAVAFAVAEADFAFVIAVVSVSVPVAAAAGHHYHLKSKNRQRVWKAVGTCWSACVHATPETSYPHIVCTCLWTKSRPLLLPLMQMPLKMK